MHKHACAPHITPPRGTCMALVPHCDTNQGRWRASLSCKHQSLLVLFKWLASPFSSRNPPCPLHPPPTPLLPPPLTSALSRSSSSPSKSTLRGEGASGARGCLRQASLLGVSLCLSAWRCFQAQPSPFHIQMLQSGLWPTGGSLWLRPQVARSRWWFNSSGRGKERGCQVI